MLEEEDRKAQQGYYSACENGDNPESQRLGLLVFLRVVVVVVVLILLLICVRAKKNGPSHKGPLCFAQLFQTLANRIEFGHIHSDECVREREDEQDTTEVRERQKLSSC